jgi:hypothetical protein
VYELTETAPFITVCAPLPEHADLSLADRAVVKARQGIELLTLGELRVVRLVPYWRRGRRPPRRLRGGAANLSRQ